MSDPEASLPVASNPCLLDVSEASPKPLRISRIFPLSLWAVFTAIIQVDSGWCLPSPWPYLVLKILQSTLNIFVNTCAIWFQHSFYFIFFYHRPFHLAYWYIHIWVFIYLCKYIFMYVPKCGVVCMPVCGDQKLTSECSVTTLHLSFWDQILPWTWSSLIRVD